MKVHNYVFLKMLTKFDESYIIIYYKSFNLYDKLDIIYYEGIIRKKNSKEYL